MECVEIVKAPSSVDKQQWLEAIFVVRSIEHGYEYRYVVTGGKWRVLTIVTFVSSWVVLLSCFLRSRG